MTIEEIRVYEVPLESRASYTMSNSTVATPMSTIVDIEDSSGVVGYGEACLASPQFQPAHRAGVEASLSILAPAIIGLNPMQLGVVNTAMDRAMTRRVK